MIKNKSRQLAKWILLLLLYLTVFLYTITFSTPVSWLILYFFTAVLLTAFLSTFIFWKQADFTIIESRQNQLNGQLSVHTKGLFPILIPYVTLSVSVLGESFSTTVPSLFKTHLTASFSNIHVPRGHHKSIEVQTSGRDFFGFFTHHKAKKIPTQLMIYPKRLASDLLYPTLKQIDSKLKLKPLSGQSDVTFRQLREHQLQDPLKDIDWKSSFKKQELMVKEYDKEADTALKLYFIGCPSPQFEELLSLTYSLYVELARYQKVQLYLIGEFDQHLMLKQNTDAFLTIQPTEQIDQVKALWSQHSTTRNQKIVAAPIEIVTAIKEIETRSAYFLSEETVAKLHIGGD